MSSKSKRLPLTLDPELGKLIEDIAELRGIKQTRVVTDILEECKPQLQTIRDALYAIKNNEKADVNSILTKMLGDSFQNMSDLFKGLNSD